MLVVRDYNEQEYTLDETSMKGYPSFTNGHEYYFERDWIRSWFGKDCLSIYTTCKCQACEDASNFSFVLDHGVYTKNIYLYIGCRKFVIGNTDSNLAENTELITWLSQNEIFKKWYEKESSELWKNIVIQKKYKS